MAIIIAIKSFIIQAPGQYRASNLLLLPGFGGGIQKTFLQSSNDQNYNRSTWIEKLTVKHFDIIHDKAMWAYERLLEVRKKFCSIGPPIGQALIKMKQSLIN